MARNADSWFALFKAVWPKGNEDQAQHVFRQEEFYKREARMPVKSFHLGIGNLVPGSFEAK
jgi:hypothetical protein